MFKVELDQEGNGVVTLSHGIASSEGVFTSITRKVSQTEFMNEIAPIVSALSVSGNDQYAGTDLLDIEEK